MKFFAAILFLIPALAFADAMTVNGMTCHSCEKQVTSTVCEDGEISQWFETCGAKVISREKAVGEIRYTLKKGVTLDSEKMIKIEKALAQNGRSIAKSTEKSATK